MNKTNLHKLHQGYIINSQNRRSGKTTRLIYDIIGEIQLGDKKDIYVNCVFSKNIRNFQNTFIHYLNENGIELVKKTDKIWHLWFEDNVKVITFTTIDKDELKGKNWDKFAYYKEIVK